MLLAEKFIDIYISMLTQGGTENGPFVDRKKQKHDCILTVAIICPLLGGQSLGKHDWLIGSRLSNRQGACVIIVHQL